MTQIKFDTLKLTSSLARAMRRAFTTETVTENNAIYALECYNYFLCMGGKRPFLHDKRSGIVCPMCPEVVAQIELSFDIPIKAIGPGWERQEKRNMRHQLLKAHRLDKIQKERDMQSTKVVEIMPIQKIAGNDPVADEFNAINMALTPVIWKISGGMLIALVLLDSAKKKNAIVFHITKDGFVLRARNGSVAQKYTQAELDAKGWQTGKLGDERFYRILSCMTDPNDTRSVPKLEQSKHDTAAA